MAKTNKQNIRAVRQEELREYISQQGKLKYVFDNIKKIEDVNTPLDAVELKRLETATASRIKLLDFYMPKQKAIEHTGEGGGDLIVQVMNYANSDS